MKLATLQGAALVVAACLAGAPARSGDAVRVTVDEVKVLQLQTYPPRITLVVSGKRLAGIPVDVSQERQGDEIVVTLTQAATEASSQAHEAFKLRVALRGVPPKGRYRLRVNDYTTELEV